MGEGLAIRLWLTAMRLGRPLLERHLQRRVAKGKELPDRWREKLGQPSLERPSGQLVWLHAVGLGEALALRGFIARWNSRYPSIEYLVTTGTRGAAEVMADQMPPRTRHQFLPFDHPDYINRFLDHWRPELSIWVEQDIWPGAVYLTAKRKIPLALINARMNAASYRKRRRARALYRPLLAVFSHVSAQDPESAAHLDALAGRKIARVFPSLKTLSLPLRDDPETRERCKSSGPSFWLLASSHPADEALALEAARQFPEKRLVIAPRRPDRAGEILETARALGMKTALRSDAPIPADTQVYVIDRLGELGLWYRDADVTFIGGTMGDTEGHNPWEAVALGCPLLHGPRVANFKQDYAALGAANAATCVDDVRGLLTALRADLSGQASRAKTLWDAQQTALDPLIDALQNLVKRANV